MNVVDGTTLGQLSDSPVGIERFQLSSPVESEGVQPLVGLTHLVVVRWITVGDPS